VSAVAPDGAETFDTLTVLSGNPTAEELAAVTAVIEATLNEQGENDRHSDHQGPSAWQRSQRGLRATLRPGHGVWRGFSG